MKSTLRLSGLALALLLTFGLVMATTAPAQARTDGRTATTTGVDHVPVARGDGAGPSLAPGQQLASSNCSSWLSGPRACINFSRSEQTYLSGVSLTVATAFICARLGIISCAVAGSVAFALQKFIDNRGGICPTHDPILEVEYAPRPGGYAKCSDG